MRSDGIPGDQVTASGRDRMDAFIESWRREVPGSDRPELELAKRAVRLGRLLDEALSRFVAPRKLAMADFYVLTILRTAGAPYQLHPTDLRNHLLLTSGGIANIVSRLERMQLVERIPDQADGRSSWVRLTADGIEITEEMMPAWDTAQQKIFGDVDPQLARQVADMLRTVLQALGDREPAAPAARQAARP
jgi:DNA-binding MarR family transcriptional regulator